MEPKTEVRNSENLSVGAFICAFMDHCSLVMAVKSTNAMRINGIRLIGVAGTLAPK